MSYIGLFIHNNDRKITLIVGLIPHMLSLIWHILLLKLVKFQEQTVEM